MRIEKAQASKRLEVFSTATSGFGRSGRSGSSCSPDNHDDTFPRCFYSDGNNNHHDEGHDKEHGSHVQQHHPHSLDDHCSRKQPKPRRKFPEGEFRRKLSAEC